uniref:Uncharacterized protein n=1 Tax=Schistocephalus solidus TaxID=70667 RepID=A0A0X3PT77_SCHSO
MDGVAPAPHLQNRPSYGHFRRFTSFLSPIMSLGAFNTLLSISQTVSSTAGNRLSIHFRISADVGQKMPNYQTFRNLAPSNGLRCNFGANAAQCRRRQSAFLAQGH